jgi:hypothetical protein
MQSKIIAMLVPENSLAATMLVRRASGQFAFERIDARVAAASRVAAGWPRRDVSVGTSTDSNLIDCEMIEEAAA